jgi:hypothetical protein
MVTSSRMRPPLWAVVVASLVVGATVASIATWLLMRGEGSESGSANRCKEVQRTFEQMKKDTSAAMSEANDFRSAHSAGGYMTPDNQQTYQELFNTFRQKAVTISHLIDGAPSCFSPADVATARTGPRPGATTSARAVAGTGVTT